MNLSKALFIIAVLLSLAGCGTVNAVNQTCNLSTLKIRKFDLVGDDNGLATAAIKRELFAHGAKWSYDYPGVKIIGRVSMSGSRPIGVVVEVEGQPFAGIGYTYMIQPNAAADQLGRMVARDFCRCMAEGNRIHSLALKE